MEWKVSREKVFIKPHPNPEVLKLELGVVGEYQIVTQKGVCKDGETVIFIPEKSLVPDEISVKYGFKNYLVGTDKNRVKAICLQKEPSMGVTIPDDPRFADKPLGEDISGPLGITKYDPPIPPELAGKVQPFGDLLGPGLHIVYHDVDLLAPHLEEFDPNEIVVITEKIHGCVTHNVRVVMADGSYKRITKVKKGDSVLGVDGNGLVVSTLVTNLFNNGESDQWMRIRFDRKNAGRGSNFGSIDCTPNHQFWSSSSNTYVKAVDLKEGDSVSVIRTDYKLSPVQVQVLVGKMLGDGSYSETGTSACVSSGHKSEHREYLQWTLDFLGDIAHDYVDDKIVSGFGTSMSRGRTSYNAFIKQEFGEWVCNGEKHIPENIEEKMSPISLAFWYMDDGGLCHDEGQEDRIELAVCGFDEDDCLKLIKCLKKFNVQGDFFTHDGYNRIRINSEEAEKFFLLISPYVPCCMQYKLPERYRGFKAWNPMSAFNPSIVSQRILSVDKINRNKIKSMRYNIETETNNFFANGVLVHNSQLAAVRGPKGERIVSSKGMFKSGLFILESDTNTYWRAMKNTRLFELVDELFPGAFVQVFGEAVPVQKKHGIWFNYGFREPWCLVYRLRVDNVTLEIDQIPESIKKLWVPVLYVGKMDLDVLKSLSNGKEQVSGKEVHIKEGTVMQPKKERLNKGGHYALMVKWLNVQYDPDDDGVN